MADNKSCEGKRSIDKPSMTIRDDEYVKPLTPKKKGSTDLDIPNTIKGLKAIQREAKKATAALKELEEQKKTHDRDVLIKTLAKLHGVPEEYLKNTEIKYTPLSEIGGYKPHTAIFDELHGTCPKCGKDHFKESILYAGTGKNKEEVNRCIKCLECGWTS